MVTNLTINGSDCSGRPQWQVQHFLVKINHGTICCQMLVFSEEIQPRDDNEASHGYCHLVPVTIFVESNDAVSFAEHPVFRRDPCLYYTIRNNRNY